MNMSESKKHPGESVHVEVSRPALNISEKRQLYGYTSSKQPGENLHRFTLFI